MAHTEHPVLHVAHASSGRLRLRVRHAKEGDLEYLTEIAERIGEMAGVKEVRITPRTGSMLVLCTGEPEPVLTRLQELTTVAASRPSTPMLRLQEAVHETNRRLAGSTGGIVTLDRIMLVATTLGGLWQTRAGNLLPAGTTLFEYALNAIQREANRERDMEHERELARMRAMRHH